jgi:transposase
MRYELSDFEWTAIKPMIPSKPHGVWRDRCLLSLALPGATQVDQSAAKALGMLLFQQANGIG